MLEKILDVREFNDAEKLEIARVLGSGIVRDYLKSLAKETLTELADMQLIGRSDGEITKALSKAQGRLEGFNTLLSIEDIQSKE